MIILCATTDTAPWTLIDSIKRKVLPVRQHGDSFERQVALRYTQKSTQPAITGMRICLCGCLYVCVC